MHPSGSTSPCHLRRGMKANKPVKGPVLQTDEDKFHWVKMVSTPPEYTE